MVARALAGILGSAKGATGQVLLAGGWDDAVDRVLKTTPRRLDAAGVSPIRIARTDFTTIKWRVYERTKAGHRFLQRLDRDLSLGEHKVISGTSWPRVTEIDAVLVMDFKKGLLAIPALRMALAQYTGKIFILRTKGKAGDPVLGLPWTHLLTNRQELGRLADDLDLVPDPAIRKIKDKEWRFAPGLCSALERIPTRKGRRTVIVKLDKEGAVLLENGALSAVGLGDSLRGAWRGIGAGDMLTGYFVHQLIRGEKAVKALKVGVAAATAYCRSAEKVEQAGRYGIAASVEAALVRIVEQQIEVSRKAKLLKDEQKDHAEESRVRAASVRTLNIHAASWFLEGFSTVDEKLGREVLRLRRHVSAYAELEERDGRPFVAAICGGPGSGKSTLAKQLARAAGCEYVEENVAQWQSWEDLGRVCERIRTIRLTERLPLVFLDEVDAFVLGEPVYGKLLAPLWDREYRISGTEMRLGPTVFLLAGSNEFWRNAQKLSSVGEGRGDKQEKRKLRDLVSRFNVVPIQLPEWPRRKGDRLYIAVQILMREFPLTKRIERGVLRRLIEGPAHGPRSIERAAWMFEPKEVDILRCGDLLEGDEEGLEAHYMKGGKGGWRKDDVEVSIEA